MRGTPPNRTARVAALVVSAMVVGGCAGLPRIDPSGERVFIWPNQNRTASLPAGNPQLPPVYTDPIFPQPTPGTNPAGATAGVLPPTSLPTTPPETLSITPNRVLAPIGSEVILKSGICTDDQYLLTAQKVEWLIAQQGVGEIVSMSGKGAFEKPLLPWNKPKKVDNQYGIGYTSKLKLCLDRGTSDETDDVNIEPGEAWVSVTSPVEGSSHVTAVAQAVSGWPQRRAQATVYWVDVQWTFPAPAIAAGSSQVLTTVVRRQSDGTPLAGWIVRYEVADGAANLQGGQTGQATEVTTGADGQASVDVTPTGGSGTNTQVKVQLVRPAGLGGTDMPLLVVANGLTNITWSGSDYLPPADNLGSTLPPITMPGGTADNQSSTPITPSPPTAGRPLLDLEIIGEDTGQVGGEARYELVIHNNGNALATGITVDDRFDAGFRHAGDTGNTNHINKTLAITLPAGQTYSEVITFQIVGPGRICHDVTVRCAEGSEAAKRACMNVAEPPPQVDAGLELHKTGPRLATVGESALITLSVKNTGQVPLTNLVIIDEYDTVFSPNPRTPGSQAIQNPDNKPRLRWAIPRLEAGESRVFEVDCLCKAPKQRACSMANATAEGGPGVGVIPTADEACVEIREARSGAPGDVMPPAGGAVTGLRLSIQPYNRRPLAGSRATFQFFVENASSGSDEQIVLAVGFPAELVPDMATLQSTVPAQLIGNELRFNPIASLRPQERISFTVTTSVVRSGIVNVVATATSQNSPQGVQKTEQVEILGF